MKRQLLGSFILLISLFMGVVGCQKEECMEKPKADCICTMIYDPVIGCNGKTYGNACEAECVGISYTYKDDRGLICD